jgi:hypothetical protein
VRLAIEASRSFTTNVTLEKLVAREGKLRIEASEDRPTCSTNATTFQSDDGIWRVASMPDSSKTDSELHRIEFKSLCFANEKRGTVTFRFVNEGATPLDFEWQAKAWISGMESDEPPEGEFVRAGVLP